MNNVSVDDIELSKVDSVVSNAEPETRAIKINLLLGFFALAVFIIIGSVIVSVVTSDDSKNVQFAAERSPNNIAAGVIDQSAVTTFANLSPSNQELLGSLPAALSKLDKLDDRLDSISLSVESLKSELSNLNSEVNNTLYDFNQSIDVLSRSNIDIRSSFKSLHAQFGDISKSVNAISSLVKQRSKKPSVSTTDSKVFKPPFNLVSIQVWNGAPIAVVNSHSKYLSLKEHDVIDVWSVLSVKTSPDCLTVKHVLPNSKEKLLCL
jgi:methyl-accepting chemotaxis protein